MRPNPTKFRTHSHNVLQLRKVSYHNFPRDDALRKQWISAIRRDNWTPSKHATVCSDHFAPEAYKDSVRLMQVFGLAKPNFRRYLKAHAVPTVFDEAARSQPRTPRGTAVKRRAQHDVQDAPGMADPEDHHARSYQNGFSCEAATTPQHSDAQDEELQVRDVFVQTVPHAQKSKSVQTRIKNPSVGVQVSPLSVCDSSAQTEDEPVYSGEIELGPLCSTPRRHVDAPDLHLYRTDYLSDKMSCYGDSDSDIIDCTKDSSYICDELNDDDSDLEPPVQEMCADEGVGAKKYIVFETCLTELLKCCRVCGAPDSAVDIATTGTMISATIKCTKNHVTKWCSQPVVQGKALANSHGDEKLFLARWLSILRHVVNVHDHPDPLHPSCIHGQIPERDWLIEGSESYQRLKAILAAPHLLRDLPRASQKAQTSGLEAFHSLLIHFAPKSSKFTYEGMMAR
ncbi:hypothetical protein HPB50_014544 [Hyalomma asiaticum]|uniref:Uncharacterized protein n=1 Tax=Hyalomma asiaticum TaxID=266040 RepID=A0ACB7THN1_HYAAI|nr:hypothetical protein HPB50_014544 [Hyalomma asiaticum]